MSRNLENEMEQLYQQMSQNQDRDTLDARVI